MAADYSDERRAHALWWLRRMGVLDDPELSESARVLAAVGLVICDENGSISRTELDAAINDPSVENYARKLLEEARLGAV